ncbi:ABC transporter ATP-binding protein [Dechloromonas sp. XY25]|uniref:ABC transporter ATP-binding protein n=1 Tax=Dechloromonas hankyongensis TaxID=2908002 RepID=A0ABS9JZ92_9RHOO|nr:ABC transporter ATP-binding protein [Dechloromonas hankyongensis]MCG2576224.1 ABC transporter ATP-binding protein [Dechloromonas hankyongensis]
MTEQLIEIRNVHKAYGAVKAVDGVDLAVGSGELFGLIGHNGAGKTTLFKMMLGLLPASSGDIHIGGQAVRGEAFRQVRRSIGYLPESLALYDNLTGLETLHFFARLKGVDRATCPALLDRVGLAGAAGQRVRNYSKGMRQRLGFAQALLGTPRLLFLDEPTNGLDPQGILEFYRILAELRQGGVTVVLTSHILAEIQQRVDRLALMRNGRIQALGTVQALRHGQDLPLTLRVSFRPGDENLLLAALAALNIAPSEMADGSARFACPRQQKMAVLAALTAAGPAVRDIDVHEPSLEDIFLGYAEEEA